MAAVTITDLEQLPPPSDLAVFLRADDDLRRGLAALSAAESLTDELAVELLSLAGVKNPEAVIAALHMCNFVVERNSEWHFAERARDYLQDLLRDEPELERLANARLLEIASSAQERRAFAEIPRYLTETAGRAYHSAPFDAQAALAEYSRLALAAPARDQWLATRLADEQQQRGVLPASAIEVAFLRGMFHYRQRENSLALPWLQEVARTDEVRIEVAIAAHLVGRIQGREALTPEREALLRRSLEIGEEINAVIHQAQVMHTLGQLVGRNASRRAEAEELLQRSLRLGIDEADEEHQAQVLHSLGQLVGRQAKRRSEADELLRRSLEIGERFGNLAHQAQVLYSLGRLWLKVDSGAALSNFRRSLTLNHKIQNWSGVAQVQSAIDSVEGPMVTREARSRVASRSPKGAAKSGPSNSVPSLGTADVGHDPLGDATRAVLHTNYGDITVDLFPDHAPKTVANFADLAEGRREWTDPRTRQTTTDPLYDGTVFHRIIDGFMIQGGDPLGQGIGGPGYQFGDEFHPDLSFDSPYLLAMANAGPGTNGSQFFITVARTPHLNGKHTIFGEVADQASRDVVDRIAKVSTGRNDRPMEDIVIEAIEVVRGA